MEETQTVSAHHCTGLPSAVRSAAAAVDSARSAAQRSAVQSCSAAQRSAVQECSAVQCSAVLTMDVPSDVTLGRP